MFIYAVMRFGNDQEGPDGEDTEFIVLSSSVDEAAKIVDTELKKMPHSRVAPYCHAVTVIGESFSESEKTLILSGPTLTRMSMCSVGIPAENIWRRCEETGEGEWVILDEY